MKAKVDLATDSIECQVDLTAEYVRRLDYVQNMAEHLLVAIRELRELPEDSRARVTSVKVWTADEKGGR